MALDARGSKLAAVVVVVGGGVYSEPIRWLFVTRERTLAMFGVSFANHSR